MASRNPDFDFPHLVQAATALEEALYNSEIDVEDYPNLAMLPHISGATNGEPKDARSIVGVQEQHQHHRDLCETEMDADLPYKTGLQEKTQHSRRPCDTKVDVDMLSNANNDARPGEGPLPKVLISDANIMEEETEAEEAAHLRRKRMKHVRAHTTRSKKRIRECDGVFSHHTARPSVQEKYVKTAVPIVAANNLAESNVASTGFVGLDDRVRDKHEYTLEELVGPSSDLKFEYVAWDGR